MTRLEQQYPEVEEYLDNTDKYKNKATEFEQGGDRYLIITQKGIDGQQLLFKWNGKRFEYRANETIINSAPPPIRGRLDETLTTCGPSSDVDHGKAYRSH